MKSKYTNVYAELVAAGVPLDNHGSDLYALATAEAVRIVKASGYCHSFFRSAIDGKMWLEVHFAFYPFWERRQSRVSADI